MGRFFRFAGLESAKAKGFGVGGLETVHEFDKIRSNSSKGFRFGLAGTGDIAIGSGVIRYGVPGGDSGDDSTIEHSTSGGESIGDKCGIKIEGSRSGGESVGDKCGIKIEGSTSGGESVGDRRGIKIEG